MKTFKKSAAFLLAAVLLVSSLFTATPIYKLFAAEGETHGNFVIQGGTYGVDYEYITGTSPIQIQGYGSNENYNTTYHTPKSGGVINVAMDVLKIYTSTPLTISTNGTSNAGIQIEKGVQADLTFDGVTIDALLPVNIIPNTVTKNAWGRPLVAGAADSNGNGIPDYIENIPSCPADVTVLNPINAAAMPAVSEAEDVDLNGDGTPDYLENPTSLYLTLADGSTNTLTASTINKTYQFPAIRCGEGAKLTIDDGRRNVDTDGNFVAPEQGKISRNATLQDGTVVKKGDRLTLLDSEIPGKLIAKGGFRAAAIGGSALESSGNMTFNGGNIIARTENSDNEYASVPGIGGGHAGCGTVMTFNGGTIDSAGCDHAPGVGCAASYGIGFSKTVTYAITDGYLSQFPLCPVAGNININGGYLKSEGGYHGNAFGQSCGGNNLNKTIKITGGTLLPVSVPGWYDIGGQGGDVIITGGSARLTDGDPNKFQSSGGVAWGDLDKTIKVFMTTIKMEAFNKPNMLVDNIKVSVNGIPSDYGMPSYTDEKGNLYFWLPNMVDGSAPEVRVDLVLKDQDGKDVPTEPFYITNATPGSILKQYVAFDIDDSKITDDNRLRKRYDGLPFTDAEQEEFLKAIVGSGIEVTIPAGQTLTNLDQMTLQTQRLTETLEPDESEAIISGTNANVGKYQLIITSDQFANVAGFSDAFWGHRCYYKYAEITPADSKASISVAPVSNSIPVSNTYSADTALQFKAYIAPNVDEALTCAAPTGKVQFYVNGQAFGDPVSLAACEGADEVNAAGHKQSVAKINWTPTDNGGKYAAEGIQEVYAKYIPDAKGNYTASETDKAQFNLIKANQDKPIKVTDSTDGKVIPPENSVLTKIYGDEFTLTLTGGNTDEKPVYVSSNPEIATVDEDGNVTIVGVGETVITATRPGNGTYKDISQDITIIAKKKELKITAVDILDKYYNAKTNAKYDPNSVVISDIVPGDESKVKAALKGVAEFPKADVGLYPNAFVTFTIDDTVVTGLYYIKQADGSEGNSFVLTDEASIKAKSIIPNEDPTTPGDTPTDPSKPGEDPTKPGGEDPTNPGGDPTDPTKPGETPTKPGEEITNPDDDSDVTMEPIPDQVWTGKEITPPVVLKDGDRPLVEGVDYTVEYKNNIDVGTADVIITGIGNYEGTIETTFKITPPPAKVIVNYYKQDGEKLADEVVIDGYIGDNYSTSEYTRDDFYGYQLVEIPENSTGVMTDETINVNYYYVLKSTKVIANYVDLDGKTLAESEVINGKVFDAFETHRKDIAGYDLVDIQDNITSSAKNMLRSVAKAVFAEKALKDVSGEMQEYVIVVNYIYDARTASVVANYVDEDGNEIAPSETQEYKYFENYKTEAKDIAGYTLKEVPSNASGKVENDEIIVNYVYVRNESCVIVNYVDENGKTISSSVKISGMYKDGYTTYPKSIQGFDLIKTPENEDGLFAEVPIVVTYVYRARDTKVIVKYVDENGKELAESETITGKVYDEYTTSAKEIEGYRVVKTSGNIAGEMQPDTVTVVYTYALDNEITDTGNTGNIGNKPVSDTPVDTGSTDMFMLIGYALVAVLSLFFVVLLLKRNKNNKNSEV